MMHKMDSDRFLSSLNLEMGCFTLWFHNVSLVVQHCATVKLVNRCGSGDSSAVWWSFT